MRLAGLAGALVVPAIVSAQAPAERLLAARRQVSAGQLDSARAQLVAVAESIPGAPHGQRVEALILLGIVEHFSGADSAARAAFRFALSLDTGLSVEGLRRVAPEAAKLFEQERCELRAQAIVNGRVPFIIPVAIDSITIDESCTVLRRFVVAERPRLIGGPRLRHPRPGVIGRVLIQAIVDSTGRADSTSIRVLVGVFPDMDSAAVAYVRAARFRAGRAGGRAVRTLIHLPIDFKGSSLND